jgi:3-hydroxybutyryl-CoA dehydrogenase
MERSSMQGIGVIGILGAGQMGRGIAQVVLQSGLRVILVDSLQTSLDSARAGIEKRLYREAEKGKIDGGAIPKILSYLTTSLSLSHLKESDFVIEAVPEREDLKTRLLRELDTLVCPEVILASNTSSIPITRLAQATQRPERVIGMHFMNPVPVMGLVEVIRGSQTSEETVQTTKGLAQHLGKEVVESKDSPGFIVNRILMPLINEAVFALSEGVASAEDIDRGLRLGANHPMGPLALADFIGLDICLDILEVLHRGLGDSKYRPAPLLREYVESGRLGRKSGEGFYRY